MGVPQHEAQRRRTKAQRMCPWADPGVRRSASGERMNRGLCAHQGGLRRDSQRGYQATGKVTDRSRTLSPEPTHSQACMENMGKLRPREKRKQSPLRPEAWPPRSQASWGLRTFQPAGSPSTDPDPPNHCSSLPLKGSQGPEVLPLSPNLLIFHSQSPPGGSPP